MCVTLVCVCLDGWLRVYVCACARTLTNLAVCVVDISLWVPHQ